MKLSKRQKQLCEAWWALNQNTDIGKQITKSANALVDFQDKYLKVKK